MAESYKVGDRVRAKEAIFEPADDHAPGGYISSKGDLLIVRKVRKSGKWPLSVSHEDVTDNSFACGLDEVTPDGVTGGRGETLSGEPPMGDAGGGEDRGGVR